MASLVVAGVGELIELVVAGAAETSEVLAVGDVIGETAATAAATTTAETSFITETADVVAMAETYGGAVEAVGESSLEQVAEAGVIGEQIEQMDAVVLEESVVGEVSTEAGAIDEAAAMDAEVEGIFETNIESELETELETTIDNEFDTSIDDRNFIAQRTSTPTPEQQPFTSASIPVQSQRAANIVTRQFERDFFSEYSLASRPLRALQGAARSRFVYTDLPSAIESEAEASINSFINEFSTSAESSFAASDSTSAAVAASDSTSAAVAASDSTSAAESFSISDLTSSFGDSSSSTFIYPEESSIVPSVDMSQTAPKVPFTPAPAPPCTTCSTYYFYSCSCPPWIGIPAL